MSITSPYYRNWVEQTDRALEAVHRRCQQEIADISRRSFLNIVNAVSASMRRVGGDNRFTSAGRAHMQSAQKYVDSEFEHLAIQICGPIARMQRRVLILKFSSELEVYARLKGTTFSGNPPDAPDLAPIFSRVHAALFRLGGKLKDEIERGYVLAKTPEEIIDSVKAKFPKPRRYKVPPRELKPFREVETVWENKHPLAQASLSFVTDAEWEDVVDAYKDVFVPQFRGPEYVFDREIGEPELEEWFGWEIEQEVADDFVDQVRNGMIPAAEAAGITDLMWIAIIDDKTRPEHRAKHGLTSREIQAKLDNEWADFDDQSIVPPGGFNCRCRAAPYDSEMPDAPEFHYEDIDSWLEK